MLVEDLVLRDLDLLVQQEGPTEGVQHDHRLEERDGQQSHKRQTPGWPDIRTPGRFHLLTWMIPITMTQPQKSKIPRMFSGKVAINENCKEKAERSGRFVRLSVRTDRLGGLLLTVYGRKVISIMQA